MHTQGLLILSIMALLLGTWPSCSHREGSVGNEIHSRTLSQLDSFFVSGSKEASVLVGVMGKTRDLKFTADSGVTWKIIDSHAIGSVLECATLLSDGVKGWAVNHDGQVFSTNSGGANWTKLADLKNLSSGDFTGASQIEFVTGTDGWIKESLSLWRTEDGGITWQEKLSVLTPGVKGQPGRIHAINANSLIVLGEGQVYLTRDGGDSWKIETLIPDGAGFTDVWFTDKQNGWLSGYIGVPHFRPLLFVTRNGGESWEEMPLPDLGMLPESICFVDQTQGWLAGRRAVFTGKAVPAGGVLLHTNDGGKHWTPVQIGSDDPFFSVVRFTNSQHGWLAGRDNLYRTENGGNTWRAVLKVPPIRE